MKEKRLIKREGTLEITNSVEFLFQIIAMKCYFHCTFEKKELIIHSKWSEYADWLLLQKKYLTICHDTHLLGKTLGTIFISFRNPEV